MQWALQTVESLHYLADLDEAVVAMGLEAHNLDVADIAHVRWATATCVTALDLCAAALGRAFCENTSDTEFSVAYFDPNGRYPDRASLYRSKIPSLCRDWIDGLLADPGFAEIKGARDWLTHSRIPRHFAVGGDKRIRLQLSIGNARLDVRYLIEQARDVATKHVGNFLKLVPSL